MIEAVRGLAIQSSVSDKIQHRHRDRLAMVYIRQSTMQQVERHQESTRLQYAKVGWRPSSPCRSSFGGWVHPVGGSRRRPSRYDCPSHRDTVDWRLKLTLAGGAL